MMTIGTSTNRWTVTTATLGDSEPPSEVTVKGENWMAALRAARKSLGASADAPLGATYTVSGDGSVIVLDPSSRRRFTVMPTPNASLSAQPPPPPSVQPPSFPSAEPPPPPPAPSVQPPPSPSAKPPPPGEAEEPLPEPAYGGPAPTSARQPAPAFEAAEEEVEPLLIQPGAETPETDEQPSGMETPAPLDTEGHSIGLKSPEELRKRLKHIRRRPPGEV